MTKIHFADEGYQACKCSKLKKHYDYPTPGALVGRAAMIQHAHGKETEMMYWPNPGEEPAVKTTIQVDNALAKTAAELSARRMECKIGSASCNQ